MSSFDDRRSREPGPGKSTLSGPVQKASAAPGKRTLTEARGPGPTVAGPHPIQLLADGVDSGRPSSKRVDPGYGDITAAAARGVAGGGARLPHSDTIQRAFGKHDVSGVEAHVGGEAEGASRAIGAEAYATGNHVAFAGAPDLHTAAHEAAHVVQQRGGVQLKGGVGEAGDQYERHADAVADAVVQGKSAEGLLDQHGGGGGAGGGTGPTVQRRNEPETVLTPTPAPAVTWSAITASADDPKAAANVELEWVEHLPDAIKVGIDLGYNEKDQEKKFEGSLAKDPQLAATDKPFLEEMAALENRIGPTIDPHWKPVTSGKPDPNKKATVDKLHSDPTFMVTMKAIEARHKQAHDAYVAKARDAWDQRLVSYSATAHSRAQAPAAQVRLRDARMAMRADFVGWAASVFGSVGAAKAYFLGIQPVPDGGGMMLAADARKAFLAARERFESQHPGYTFPRTGNGFALRGFHRSIQPVSMLGHTIGQSFDFEAVDNPNQAPSPDGVRQGDVNAQFMLRRFGGDPNDPQSKGRNRITEPVEHASEVLGHESMELRSPNSEEELGKVLHTMHVALQQFEEMAATSKRLQASMADQLPALRTARGDYVDKVLKVQPTVDAAKNKLDAATTAAKRKGLTGPKLEAAVATEQSDYDTVSALYDAAKTEIQGRVRTAFKKWTDLLRADLAASHAKFTDAELASGEGIDVGTCDRVIEQVTGARTAAQLNAVAAKHAQFFDGLESLPIPVPAGQRAKPPTTPSAPASTDASAPHQVETAEQRKATMLQRAQHMRAITRERGEIASREDILDRIENNLGFVFGTELDDAHKGIALQVTHPPVMQYLEHGFVRNDEMDTSKTPAAGASKKQVFNVSVVEVLMLHGFSPGAAFPNADSMHFDFIQGYGAAIANGGRGAKGRYAADGVTKARS